MDSNDFDPDAYLRSRTTDDFDPDAYLKAHSISPEQAQAFGRFMSGPGLGVAAPGIQALGQYALQPAEPLPTATSQSYGPSASRSEELQDPDFAAQQDGLNFAMTPRSTAGIPVIPPYLVDQLTSGTLLNLASKYGPSAIQPIAQGAQEKVDQSISGLTTEDNLALGALLPFAPESAGPLISGYFAKQMGEGAGGELLDALHSKTPHDIASHLTGAVIQGGMAAMAGLHPVMHAMEFGKLDPVTETAKTPSGVVDLQTGGPISPVRAKSLEILAPEAVAPSQVPPADISAHPETVTDPVTEPQKSIQAIGPGDKPVDLTPTQEGPHVISSALKTQDGKILVGEDFNAPHVDAKDSIADLHGGSDDPVIYDSVPGFVIQDASGDLRFTSDHTEAHQMAVEGEQTEPSDRKNPILKPQDLRQPPETPEETTPSETAPPTQAAPKTPQEPPPSAPVAPVPEGTPQSPTGIRNSIIDADRQAMGLPPREAVIRLSNPAAFDQAKQLIAADDAARSKLVANGDEPGKSIGERLQDELSVQQRPLEPFEAAIMADRKLKLDDAVAEASARGKAAVESGDRSGIQKARLDQANALDAYQKWADVFQKSKTKAAQSLQANKMLLNRDYTLASMGAERTLAKGKPLTPEEVSETEAQFQKIKTAQDTETAHLAAKDEKQSQSAATDSAKDLQKELNQEKKAARPKGKVQAVASKALDYLDQKANAARERMKGRGGRLGSAVDPLQAADIAIVAAAKLAHVAGDVAAWTKSMIEEFGEKIRPHLQAFLKSAKDAVDSASNLAGITERMKSRADEGEGLDTLHPFVRSIAKEVVRGGARGWEDIQNQTHAVVKEILPDVTPREVRDAWTGYGRERVLDKSENATALRQGTQAAIKVSGIEDYLSGKGAKRTGYPRDEPDAENRTLAKARNEAKKAFGDKFPTDPAKALKSSLDSIKTRLKNQIDELSTALSKKEALPQKTGSVPYDQDALDLKARRDELKAQYDSVFKKPGMTDEARLKLATDAAQRSADKWDERLKNAQGGKFDDGTKRPVRPMSAELDAIRAHRDAAKAEVDHLRNTDAVQQELKRQESLRRQNATAEERLRNPLPQPKAATEGPKSEAVTQLEGRLADLHRQLNDRKIAANALTPAERVARNETVTQRKLQAQIDQGTKSLADLQRQISNRAIEPKDGPKLGPDSEKTAALKDKLDALGLQRDLANRKASALRSIADIKERTANQDFAKAPRKTPTYDAELGKIQAEKAAAQQDFQRALAKYEKDNRPIGEKVLDWAASLRRAAVLSGLTTVGKLTAAATENVALHPLEEAVGGALGKIPGISKIAERAPIEGGFHADAIAKGVSDTWKYLFKNMGQYLKTGQMDIDLQYGKPDIRPKEMLDFISHIHGALKTPARQYQFTTAFEKGIRFAARQGENVHDPLVQARVGLRAYEQANRSIFSDDNYLSNKVKQFFHADNVKGTGQTTAGRKAWETAGRILIPVTRIPTNIVARTLEYSPLGAALGGGRVVKALIKGTENLSPDESDSIMRNLKRGAIGSALVYLGYKNPNMFGGYYTGGAQNPDSPQYGGAKVKGLPEFDVLGHHIDTSNIPRFLLHNPLLEQLQIGATIRRVSDTYSSKKATEPQGDAVGVEEAAKGLAREVPFVNTLTKVSDLVAPGQKGSRMAALGQEMVPRLFTEGAEFVDQDPQGNPVKRKANGFWQGVESKLLYLSKNLPEKYETLNDFKRVPVAQRAQVFQTLEPALKLQVSQKYDPATWQVRK